MRLFLVAAVLAACTDPEYQPWLLEELPADDGFWVRTPEFAVAPGAEIQDCYFFEVPDLAGGADLWIDRAKLALNSGSHHMNLFRIKTINGLEIGRASC